MVKDHQHLAAPCVEPVAGASKGFGVARPATLQHSARVVRRI